MLKLLRYDVAWWLIDTFYTGGDMAKEHPMILAVADKICPGGIPDSW